MRVDHAVINIERKRLAVGWHEFAGRRHVFAIGRVQLVQHAVPRCGVDGVLAGSAGGSDYGSRGLPAGTKDAAAAPAGCRRGPRAYEMLPPELRALLDIDRKDIIGDAGDNRDLPGATGKRQLVDDQRWEQCVHLAHFVIELDLPEQLCVPYGGHAEDLLVLLPGGALHVAAVGQPIGAPQQGRTQKYPGNDRKSSHLSPSLSNAGAPGLGCPAHVAQRPAGLREATPL